MQRFSKEIQTAGTERDQGAFEFGEFRLDAGERLLTRAGEVVPLQPKTFEALLLLVRNSGHLLTKRGMLDALWPNAFVEEANLTNAISQLRRALGDTQVIETVPKHGYRFTAEVRTVAGNAIVARREVRPHVASGHQGQKVLNRSSIRSALALRSPGPTECSGSFGTRLNVRRRTRMTR